uniref:Uncharacterized protein n=1 Tax=Meloidogyne incognita TaxID=6306 RepID=A0A914KG63_MELIC
MLATISAQYPQVASWFKQNSWYYSVIPTCFFRTFLRTFSSFLNSTQFHCV